MRSTVSALAKAYTPMIKFVGGKHPIIKHTGGMHAHPCSVDGLLPGSSECVALSDYLSKLRPFKVVPYKNPSAGKQSGSTKSSNGAHGKSKYLFVERPLQENEVHSISQLPARFRFKPIDDAESAVINGGGAL